MEYATSMTVMSVSPRTVLLIILLVAPVLCATNDPIVTLSHGGQLRGQRLDVTGGSVNQFLGKFYLYFIKVEIANTVNILLQKL